MPNFYSKFSRFSLFFFLLVSGLASGQLSNFDFGVAPTSETCTGNGSVAFTVANTTPGASMLFSIYLLPDTTTPITVTSESDFEGLTSGNYLAVATQTLNGDTGTQNENFTIENDIESLFYTISTELGECQLSMNIIVNVETGHPAFYEILSGPVTFGPQPSNIFNVTQGGTYLIRVTDECGEALVQTHTFVFSPGTSLPFSANATTETVGCNLIEVNQTFTTVGVFAYPLQVVYTVYPPSGDPVTNTFEVETGGTNTVTIVQGLTLQANETYSYSIVVTDACGHIYDDEGKVENDPQEPLVSPSEVTCTSTSYTLYYASAGTIIAAPEAYPGTLPFVLTMTGEDSFLMQGLPAGSYTILALDLCGNEHEVDFIVEPIVANDPQTSIQLGCSPGFASIYIRAFEGVETIEMIAAPPTYPYPLPYTLNAFLDASDALRLSNLPEGSYTFHIVNTCGMEWTFSVYVPGLVYEASINPIQHCGSFDLEVNYTDNSTSGITFWLQKYNPVTGNWQHPVTGQVYNQNTAITLGNALPIQGGMNLNLLFTGHLRVVSYRLNFSTIEAERHCINVLGEFDILSAPVIDDAYSFSCNGTTFDVVVDAHGMDPLQYQITTYNSGPFVVDNGDSNLFTGLQPGTYNFRVEDVCGNIANRLFEISEPYAMEIVGQSSICEGSTAAISVPDYSFLSYSWYMDNPDEVLSTSASLEIPNISADDLGTYYVHIFTNNPESCIDLTLQYTIDAINPIARAGDDSSETYCGNPGNMDLSTFLGGDFQPGGTWSETTSSGTFSIDSWDATSVAPGTYVFVYTQTSECSPNDISVHSFTINPAPENPVAFIEQDVCQQGDLQLLSTTIPGAAYQWTGPNGFTSAEQNPVIVDATSANNGTYSVQAFIGDCPSQIATLEIVLAELPSFTLSASCEDNRMMIAAPNDTAEEFTYAWTGPNGFTSSQNPADITGNAPGDYSLTVTNAAGCTATSGLNVPVTMCQIPKGVSVNGDGANDTWNLGGFGDGLKVKIFNRYGMVVFEMNDYVNQWHGQCKDGSLLPSATYYYYIQDAVGEEKTGWVYLLRNE